MEKTVSAEFPQATLDFLTNTETHNPTVPKYLEETYWWAYLHPRAVHIFERQWIVNLILWGNFAKLRDASLKELGTEINGHTLQVACVYGDFTPKLAARLAPSARLDVVDVAPIQLKNLLKKMGPLGDRNNVFPKLQNAANLSYEEHSIDQAVVFFLLHELPEEVRAKAVQEVLRVVKPGGKIVFVDYHKPVWMHPHRYLMQPILRTLEPFAMDLWHNEISHWIPDNISCSKIEKTTYFGGLYQKVVVTR